ncbi:Zinc finger BED domain-containing protein 5 [Trichinella patagoniensis]|uniref:Zinc finger BED domain-containing protein 5 n=1 Tax=Trichinella patagoniensis TaxID=990121 RepID=A0A0V1A897_9BILA|nr:Zinc finger BED domain-containing protein 5 [Trichinella patagoniensis]
MKICQPISWMANPFRSDISTGKSTVANKELIDLSEDTVLKMNFNRNKLTLFWMNVLQTYPDSSASALKVVSIHIFCEIGFSVMVTIKTQFQNRLQLSDSLRLKMTAIEVDIDAVTRQPERKPILRMHPKNGQELYTAVAVNFGLQQEVQKDLAKHLKIIIIYENNPFN